MHIPRNMGLLKFDQLSRDSMCNDLLKRHSLPKELKLGATVSYLYYYDKVQVVGKAIIIGKCKTSLGSKLILCGENNIVIKMLYNPDVVSFKVIKYSNKKIRRAKLNYLVKK